MAQMRRPPADWPHPEWSDQRIVGPHRWHVQDSATSGPVMLFLHGSGASVHSWRALMDIFAGEYRVVALDLPGQGFSTPAKRSRFGLDPMAKDVLAFLDEGDISPDLIVGHSAGAAVALRMTQLRGNAMPIIGINPALGHFEGMAGWLFPVLAKVLALNPLTPWLFTMSANARQTKALIEGTGSSIDEAGLRYYEVLVSDRVHVDGTLQMMARWDLDGLLRELPRISAPCLFVVGAKDQAVPPKTPKAAAAKLPNCALTELPDCGHLAHEEAPEVVAGLIREFVAGLEPRQ